MSAEQHNQIWVKKMSKSSRIRRSKQISVSEPEKFDVVHQNPDDPNSPIVEFSFRDSQGSVIRAYMREEEPQENEKPTIITLG